HWFRDRPSHRPGDPDPAAHHGDGAGPGTGTDRGPDGPAQAAAGAAAAVPDVAVPRAERRGPRRLAGHLRLRGQELPGPPPDRVVAGLAGARLRGVRDLGPSGEGLAVRPEGDRGGVPRRSGAGTGRSVRAEP